MYFGKSNVLIHKDSILLLENKKENDNLLIPIDLSGELYIFPYSKALANLKNYFVNPFFILINSKRCKNYKEK